MPFAESYKGDAKAPLSSKAIGYAMACTAFRCAQMPRPLGRGFFTIFQFTFHFSPFTTIMSDTVIKVENLGKKYLIKHEQRERYTALRDVMAKGAKRFGKKILSPFTFHRSQSSNSPFTESKEDFWALKDVSFEIKQGERVGIIGRNGAGKTTLLKLLSRITEPTTGRITLKGRVASLLEVGTGFHPELTGRENIFLNGAILGMSKVEIKKKFDEIVEFAEIEKFLDTPVKRYSSGMYVRLAFAVAAHLEPEILIVDEVLAVGDAQFQKKCLGKMEEVGIEGRSVLFVSHNMGMISHLCNKALLLKEGQVFLEGKTEDIIASYMKIIEKKETRSRSIALIEKQNKEMYISEVQTINDEGFITSVFKHYDIILLKIQGFILKCFPDIMLGFTITDCHGRRITSSQVILDLSNLSVNGNSFVANVVFPKKFLVPGQYFITVALHIPMVQMFDYEANICNFTIVDAGSEFSMYEGTDYGCVYVDCKWDFKLKID
jgi:lipopolysaccharide transport system ATP-binding protein